MEIVDRRVLRPRDDHLASSICPDTRCPNPAAKQLDCFVIPMITGSVKQIAHGAGGKRPHAGFVIPAQAGIHEKTGFRVKPGMTELRVEKAFVQPI